VFQATSATSLLVVDDGHEGGAQRQRRPPLRRGANEGDRRINTRHHPASAFRASTTCFCGLRRRQLLSQLLSACLAKDERGKRAAPAGESLFPRQVRRRVVSPARTRGTPSRLAAHFVLPDEPQLVDQLSCGCADPIPPRTLANLCAAGVGRRASNAAGAGRLDRRRNGPRRGGRGRPPIPTRVRRAGGRARLARAAGGSRSTSMAFSGTLDSGFATPCARMHASRRGSTHLHPIVGFTRSQSRPPWRASKGLSAVRAAGSRRKCAADSGDALRSVWGRR